MALSVGTRLGPYEIESAIGAGGMGEVYRARDTRLDRAVAIKVLNSSLAATPEVKQRFEREAKVISQLQHPHICVLHDVGSENGTDFLVMEYLEGESLADRLRRGPLPAPELLTIAIQLADALEKAHRAGVIHRDLKPGNVLLTKSGAKLLDFGLAKPFAATAAASGSPASASVFAAAMTQTSPAPSPSAPLSTAGSLVGTVQYMSPEQIQGMEADARSDIFAFGVMLYEMATGKRAFAGKTQASLVGQILAVDPPSVTALNPESPAGLDRTIRLCLDKDPDERIQTAHDLKLNLRAIADGPATQVPLATRTKSQRRLLLWVAFSAVVAGSVVGAMLFALRPKPAPPTATQFRIDLGDLQIANGSGSRIAVSPDGRTVALLLVSDKLKPSIYLRHLDSLDVTLIPGTEGAADLFFSPDGRWIGFSLAGKLEKVLLSGGVPVTVCDIPQDRVPATWGDNGTIVFSTLGGVETVSADGGSPAPLAWAPKVRIDWVQFLPGGHAFLAVTRNEGRFDIDLLRMDTHTAKTIVHDGSWPRYLSDGYLVYAQFGSGNTAPGFSGGLLAVPFDLKRLQPTGPPIPALQGVTIGFGGAGFYDISPNGTLAYIPGTGMVGDLKELVWSDRSGKITPIDAPIQDYRTISLSANEKTVLSSFAGSNGQPDVYTFDLARKTPQRLTFDSRSIAPIFTPDGKRIIFASLLTPTTSIWSKASDGSGDPLRLLPAATSPQVAETVSPDGNTLLYIEIHKDTQRDIYGMSLHGDPAPHAVLNSKANETMPEFSPDGKFIAYVSDESGINQVFVHSLASTGGKWQISNDQGIQPHWSRDGKQLFYAARGGKLMVVNVNTSNGFTADSPRLVFESDGFGRSGYAVARDGRILWARPQSALRQDTEVNVIENFNALVRQRTQPAAQQRWQ